MTYKNNKFACNVSEYKKEKEGEKEEKKDEEVEFNTTNLIKRLKQITIKAEERERVIWESQYN